MQEFGNFRGKSDILDIVLVPLTSHMLFFP